MQVKIYDDDGSFSLDSRDNYLKEVKFAQAECDDLFDALTDIYHSDD